MAGLSHVTKELRDELAYFDKKHNPVCIHFCGCVSVFQEPHMNLLQRMQKI